jgi:hypothetical protein
MNTDLKYYIKQFDNFIEKDICEKTIEEMKKIEFHQHTFYNVETGTNSAVLGSKELSVSWGEVSTQKLITEKLKNCIKDYIEYINMPWFKSFQAYSIIRFNKYDENTEMALHCDHIHSMFDGKRKGIPILSVLGILNNNYEGGEFIMFDNYKINLKIGDVLIFPSIFLYPHKVKSVNKGTRYSFISWVW